MGSALGEKVEVQLIKSFLNFMRNPDLQRVIVSFSLLLCSYISFCPLAREMGGAGAGAGAVAAAAALSWLGQSWLRLAYFHRMTSFPLVN